MKRPPFTARKNLARAALLCLAATSPHLYAIDPAGPDNSGGLLPPMTPEGREEFEKWFFVITDVIQVLTDTSNPSDYLKKMRLRDEELSKGWGQFVTPLSVETVGGKQKLNCANVE